MEDKNQYSLKSDTSIYDSPLPSFVSNLHTPPPDGVNGTALDATITDSTTHRGWGHTWPHLSWTVIIALAAVTMIAGGAFWLYTAKNQTNRDQETASNFSKIEIPLADLLTGKDLSLSGASNVTINGTLNLGQDLLLTPSLQPTGAKPGQIYYDQGTNELAYYNGENFVFLSSPDPSTGGVQSLGGATGQVILGPGLSSSGNQLDNSGVLTVQGQSGDVSFTAGPGLVVNGTTFSNSGILGVTAGSSNVTVTDDGNGNVSISVEEPIAGTGTVTSSGGTNGTIPLFTTSQNIEDSIITQAGLAVSIAGSLQLGNALTVVNGGTGAMSLTANGVLIGQGTGAVTSVAAGGNGLCLLSTAGAPVWGACPGGGGSGVSSLNGLTGGLTIANASAAGSTITIDDATTSSKGIASFNSTNFSVTGGAVNTAQNIHSGATPTFVGVNTNSVTSSGALTVGISAQTALLQGSTTTITSNGAGNNIVLNSAATIELQDNTNVTGSVTASGDVAVNGGDITSSGALNIVPGGTLTVGSSSQTLTLQGGATSSFRATNGANTTIVAFASPTANATLNFPALAAGTYTICTTSGNCASAAATLQSVYDNSSSPEIVLDATRGAFTIRDNASALGANLLEVQNNAGSTTYFAVTASGATVTGTAVVSGNINSTGGSLQTNGTSRIDNSGNLINVAAITASGNATFQGGTATLGTNAQAGTIVLNDGSSNTGTLQVAALGQNTVYTLPDPGAGTVTICLTTGNCAGTGGGVTTTGGTTNRLPKFTGSQALGDSTISDDGTNVTVSVDVIIQGGDLTVGSASQAASVILHDGNGQTTTLQAGNSAGNLTFVLPTNTGSANQCLKQSGAGNQLVWQDCDGGSGGSSATLQTAYDNSTDPEIVLNSSVGGLTIRDNSTPLGTNLFEIQNSLGSTTYLAVTVSGLSVTGTATASGNVNTTGGAIQTNGTSRIDNSGNLVNIGNITGTGAVTIASLGAGNDITINGADQFIVQDSAVFNALTTFNANIDLGTNDLLGTTADIDLTNFDVVGSTGNVTAGTYNGQTISSTASFTGTVTVATALRAPLIDTATATALAIGTTNATAINLNQNTALASGKTLTVTSATTSLTGATTGDALTVSNSTSTGNIAVFNDNSTAVFTIADSGLITAKSQGTSTTAFDIQNSSSQSLFAVDTFNNTVHLRTVGRDNTSTFEAIWLQGSKNATTAFIGGNDDTSAYAANDFSGSLRFNGSNVGWGDLAYFPQGGGNGNNGQFRFSTSGSALNTTPNAKIGVGDLYVSGNAGIGTNSPSYKLDVAGDVNISSGSVYRINGTAICSGATCTPAAGSSSYIQNQSAGQQSSSSFWTSGSGRVDGGVLTNNVTSNSGALTLQAATNVISLGGSDTLTANGGFTILSGSNSSLTVNATGTGTLSLGNNATSGRIINVGATGTQANTSTTNIGTSTGAAQTVNIGSTNGTSTLTLQAGTGTATGDLIMQTAAGGIISIGGNAVVNKVLDLGSTGTTNAASTVNIAATNANATQSVTIGNTTSANNVVLLRGGSSSTAIQLQVASGGTIGVGNNAVAQTINLGTGAAAKTVSIGTTNTTSTTNISAGSGGVNINGTTSVSGQLSATSFSGSGLTDCDGTNSKLLWDATTKLFSCGTDSASAFVRKPADELVTSSTTLQQDDDLTFTVVPGETYFFQMSVNATFNSGAAGGFKYTVTAPTGSTCNLSSHGMDANGSAAELINAACGTTGAYGNTNSSYNTLITGSVVAGAGGGTTVALSWAQNSSNATASRVKAGSTLTVYKITGADLAEVYYSNDPSVSPGDVVQLDSSLQAGVKKTSQAYDSHTLGIVSTRPGHILGDDLMSSAEGTPVLLALSGRVPVKVSAENGSIEPGDFLTSSSTPGIAMKATEPGYAIAQAMTSFSGKGTGTVLAFIKSGWYEPPHVNGTDLQNSTVDGDTISSLRIEGPLTVTGDALFQGKVSVKDIEITGHITVNGDTAGTATIPSGQTFVDVTFAHPYSTSPKVAATATGFVQVEITNKTVQGFRLNIPEAKAQDISIDWISLQLKE